MKLSCVCTLGLVLIGTSIGAPGAAALNAPHPLHRARPTEPHLVEPHRASSHRAEARAVRPAAKSGKIQAEAGTAHHRTKAAADDQQPARLTKRGQARASLRRASLSSRRHRFGDFQRVAGCGDRIDFDEFLVNVARELLLRRQHLRRRCRRGEDA